MKWLIILLMASPAWAKLLLDEVRVISPKKNEVVLNKAYKSFHGKKKTRKETVLISTKPTEGNKILSEYIKSIVKKINTELLPQFGKKLKGEVLFRVQIQQQGFFDILNVNSKNPKLVPIVNNWLSSVDSFGKIPDGAGQKELQVEVPLKIK
jgi:hypothetical protein